MTENNGWEHATLLIYSGSYIDPKDKMIVNLQRLEYKMKICSGGAYVLARP